MIVELFAAKSRGCLFQFTTSLCVVCCVDDSVLQYGSPLLPSHSGVFLVAMSHWHLWLKISQIRLNYTFVCNFVLVQTKGQLCVTKEIVCVLSSVMRW